MKKLFVLITLILSTQIQGAIPMPDSSKEWQMKVTGVEKHQISLVPLLQGKSLTVKCKEGGQAQEGNTENRLGFFEAEVNGQPMSCAVYVE